MWTASDSPPAEWYIAPDEEEEVPEPRFACMECGTGIDGTLVELDDDELACTGCGSTDIDLYSRREWSAR